MSGDQKYIGKGIAVRLAKSLKFSIVFVRGKFAKSAKMEPQRGPIWKPKSNKNTIQTAAQQVSENYANMEG